MSTLECFFCQELFEQGLFFSVKLVASFSLAKTWSTRMNWGFLFRGNFASFGQKSLHLFYDIGNEESNIRNDNRQQTDDDGVTMRGRRRSKRDAADATEPPAKVSPRRRRSTVEAPSALRREDHAESLALVLSAAGQTGRFADVKMVFGLGGGAGGSNDPARVLWSHSFLLAAASPFLAALLREDSGGGGDHALHLPDVRPAHLRMVLDYLYTGAMYLTAADLAPVLGVIETLRMTCGVSVSKMVRKTEPPPSKSVSFSGRRRRPPAALRETWETAEAKAATAVATTKWVEEAKFGGGLDQIKRELTEGEEEEEPALSLPQVDQLPNEEHQTTDLEPDRQSNDHANVEHASDERKEPMREDHSVRNHHYDGECFTGI
jgi:hypothetical protein